MMAVTHSQSTWEDKNFQNHLESTNQVNNSLETDISHAMKFTQTKIWLLTDVFSPSLVSTSSLKTTTSPDTEEVSHAARLLSQNQEMLL